MIQHSMTSKPIDFFKLSSLCRNSKHLKTLKSLLIVHGLIGQKFLLGQFLKSCFELGALDVALSAFHPIKKPSLSLQNLMIQGLCNYGYHDSVLSVYSNCRVLGCPSDNFTFPFVIKACLALGALRVGKEIHCVVFRTGYEGNTFVQTALVNFYAKVGNLTTARLLLDRIPEPEVVSWNALIACYSFHGLDQQVLETFKHIFTVGWRPNLSTLATLIPVCNRLGCLDVGKSLHGFSIKSGYLENNFLVPAFISIYAGNGDLYAARELFQFVQGKNVDVWNAMISAYTQNHMPLEAFGMFRKMIRANVHPDCITFVSIIPSCEILGDVQYGESLHASVIKCGSENLASVSTALVSMYAKLKDICSAEFIFEWMPSRTLLAYNAMVSGYVRNGIFLKSLTAFRAMQVYGFSPDAVSLVSILSACSILDATLLGKSAHAFSIRKAINSDLNASNALLAFYSNCEHLAYSFKLFHQMDKKNHVSRNTLLSGCVHSGEVEKAVEVLEQMQKEGFALDLVTVISILPIFSDNGYLHQGTALHGFAIKKGFSSDISLANALINMYSKCEDLDAARLLFELMPERCVVSWNALITGYQHQNLQHEVLALFSQMIKKDQRPNYVTLLNLLPVCCSQLQGMSIHAFALRRGISEETSLVTSLMSMYARFEDRNSSLLLFEMTSKGDISLWNALISALVRTNDAPKAVAFFRDMLRMGLQPDNITVVSLISAFAQPNNLNLTHSVMAYLIHKGFDKDAVINNALIDVYAKCGDILTARKVFDDLLKKDAVSWSAMINGYRLHGDGAAALDVFSQMQLSGVRPDEITFSSVLSACGHTGLVDQGWMVFNSMAEHGISPQIRHFECIVDLLGRKGRLNEAYGVVKNLPCLPSASLLKSLLGACRTHGNVELGEKIAGMLIEMDPENSGSYVMLANIYAAAGRWMEASEVRSQIEDRQLKKAPGFSLLMGDENMNDSGDISRMLDSQLVTRLGKERVREYFTSGEDHAAVRRLLASKVQNLGSNSCRPNPGAVLDQPRMVRGSEDQRNPTNSAYEWKKLAGIEREQNPVVKICTCMNGVQEPSQTKVASWKEGEKERGGFLVNNPVMIVSEFRIPQPSKWLKRLGSLGQQFLHRMCKTTAAISVDVTSDETTAYLFMLLANELTLGIIPYYRRCTVCDNS